MPLATMMSSGAAASASFTMVATRSEALEKVGADLQHLLNNTKTDRNTRLRMRGAAISMNVSFREFGLGLLISVALVYLILMAQFTSFIDPFIILMAIPPGLAGVVMILLFTGSTLNIMSLMGVIMMTGIVVSNSILIVEFSGILHGQGLPLLEATVLACKVRLRPILMTSLATLLGMIPMHTELWKPTVNQACLRLKGEFIAGAQHKRRRIAKVGVGAMSPRNAGKLLQPGTLIITPGDRDDIIELILNDDARNGGKAPLAGVVLTDGILPPEPLLPLSLSSELEHAPARATTPAISTAARARVGRIMRIPPEPTRLGRE